MIFLQWGGFDFGNLLADLEGFGFFAYVLPFLLIFALVYAILSNIKIFEKNKGAGVIIALAVGLLALQFDFVPLFFQSIFPRFGIGLAILLIAMILAGAFIQADDAQAYRWIFFGLGGLIFLIITFSSLSTWEFMGSWWWDQYASLIIMGIIIIGAIVAVIVSGVKATGGGGGTP